MNNGIFKRINFLDKYLNVFIAINTLRHQCNKFVKNYNLTKSIYLFKKKNYSQAEDYYLKALLFRPNDKLILASFADLLYSKEQYEDAANYAQLALNIDSNFKFSRLILSKSLLKLGKFFI